MWLLKSPYPYLFFLPNNLNKKEFFIYFVKIIIVNLYKIVRGSI